MKRTLSILLLVPALLAGGASEAHHSFAATYFVDREVTVEGTLTQFMYRNPHSFVKVVAPDEKGQMQTWSVEWGGGAQLTQEHVTRDTLKAGYHYNPSTAKRLLDEAGWVQTRPGTPRQKGGQPLSILFLYSPGPQNEALVSLVQAELAGIGVQALSLIHI